MSLFPTRSWVLVTALLLGCASSALAQPGQSPVAPEIFAPGHWTPFAPVNYEPEYRWFAEPDLSEYGCDRPESNEGYFFQYDRLIWAFTRPKKTDIGSEAAERVEFFPGQPQVVVYSNDVDTSFAETEWVWGNRFELGYMVDDHGWLFSAYHAHTQDRVFTAGIPAAPNGGNNLVNMVFRDPLGLTLGWVDLNGDFYDDDLNNNNVYGRPINKFNDAGGPENIDLPPINGIPDNNVAGATDFDDRILLPVQFETFVVQNMTTTYGVELMKLWRLPRMHYGGVWEWMLGLRYMNMTDQFNIDATAPISGILADFQLRSRINNFAVGPQVGARWARTRGRWTVSTEGRFTAAVNFQQARVNGFFATNDPNDFRTEQAVPAVPTRIEASLANLDPYTYTDSKQDETFSPIGELRFETQFELTRYISLRMGYNGIVAGGKGRASRRVDYTLPKIGVLDAHKNEAFIVNGFNIGFELNR